MTGSVIEPKDPKKNPGKDSERHKAEVVSDLFKATESSAPNLMIKVVNLASVIVVQHAHAKGTVIWGLSLVLVALPRLGAERLKVPAPEMK